MKESEEREPLIHSDLNSEITIGMEKEIIFENIRKNKNVFDKLVTDGENKNKLTIEDTRDAGYELIQTNDEIEKYRP